MRINQYPKTTTLDDKDVFVVETSDGTKQIEKADMDKLISPNEETYDVAVTHRNIYRGKNLGKEFTEAQKKAIREGTFDDIYVGDYWVDDTRTWRVVDIDYFQQTIDGTFTHHLVIMPDDYIAEAVPYSTYSASGYDGSNLRSVCNSTCKNIVANFFGAEYICTSFRHSLVNQIGKFNMGTPGYYTTVLGDGIQNISVEAPDPVHFYSRDRLGRMLSFSHGDGFKAFRLNPKLIKSASKAIVTTQKTYSNSGSDSGPFLAFCIEPLSNTTSEYGTSADTKQQVGIRPYAIIKG